MKTFDEAIQVLKNSHFADEHAIRIENLKTFIHDAQQSKECIDYCWTTVDTWLEGKKEVDKKTLVSLFMAGIISGVRVGIEMERGQ